MKTFKFEWHEKIKIYKDSDHQYPEGTGNGYQSEGLVSQVRDKRCKILQLEEQVSYRYGRAVMIPITIAPLISA